MADQKSSEERAVSLSRRGLLNLAGVAAAATLTRSGVAETDNAASGPQYVYVGTYTGNGKGIYVFQYRPSDGGLDPVGIALGISNPSFLALRPNKLNLYCCNEVNSGAVTAFSIDPLTGLLTQLNMQSTQGANPAHLSVHPTGKYVLAANYSGGSIISIAIRNDGTLGEIKDFRMHTGPLGPNPGRQQDGPHPHCILTDPSGRWVLVNDLGQDRTYIYWFDPNVGKFIPGPMPFATHEPGSGPRHFAFHPNGKYFYSCDELSNTVVFFWWDAANGKLTWRQTLSTLPAGYAGNTSVAEIVIDKAGKRLFVSNRGFDSIAMFDIGEGGYLKADGWAWTGGQGPRNFTFDPSETHAYVGNQNTNNITILNDQSGGVLGPPSQFVGVGNPVCVLFR